MKNHKNEWTGYNPCDNPLISSELQKTKTIKVSQFHAYVEELLLTCQDEIDLKEKFKVFENFNRNKLLAIIDFFSENNPSVFNMFSQEEKNRIKDCILSLKKDSSTWKEPQKRDLVIDSVLNKFEIALRINN